MRVPQAEIRIAGVNIEVKMPKPISFPIYLLIKIIENIEVII